MAAATDELILLERVFLRLGSAETDDQLQASVCKFLPPVLLKLSSAQEGVRKKVLELLVHINRRVKSRPQVQLPVEALLLQYQDPTASSFMINFTIIYIKLGYPRMEMSKQAELVPSVLNAIEGKPLSHQDSLMLIIMPALGHINIPTDLDKRASLLGLQDKPYVAKQLINFMLDILLLPYGSVGQTENQQSGQQTIDWSQFTVPPGLSDYAFKRVIGESPPTAEQLEQIKLGIVKFLVGGFFPDADILIHLIVAAADTRFSIANMADLELKKIIGTLDWSSMQLAAPLYTLFLGTDALATQKEVKPEMKRLPASTRIRLKLLQYLCRVTKAGFIIPPCIQVVFDSLYGKNTNAKLKSLALQFTSNIVQHCSLVPLARVAGVILNGMIKLISEGDDTHKPMAYTVIGQLGQRIPSLINKDLSLLHNLFDTLVSTDGELRRTVRDALICVTSAFVLNKEDESNIALMNALLSVHIESPESSVRFVAMHYAATVFPSDDAPSRYLLLLACGDNKHEISTEAMKALYGVVHKNEDEQHVNNKIVLPEFVKLVSYIHSKMQSRMPAVSSGRGNTDKQVLPYSNTTFSEIITYLRVCLAKSANIPMRNEPLQHPCEHTPLIGRYLENLYKDQPEILNNYLNMILLFSHSAADQISLNALLEVLGSVPPYIVKIYEKELPWLSTLLTSTKQDVRQLAAKVYAAITAYLSRNEFEKYVSDIMDIMKKKNLEAQHGALMALIYMLERNLTQQRNENRENLCNWTTYNDIVRSICTYLHDNAILLMDAAIQGIGVLGKTYSLPLPAENDNDLNKKAIVETLFSVLSNAKLSTKMKEKAALSLGYLCIGESFPYTTEIVDKIIATVKETKDIEIHLILGEALVCCVKAQASPEGRDIWRTLPAEHVIPYSKESDELLIHVLVELLNIYQVPHPNLRQAICVWLFTLLKHNVQRECVKERLSAIHHAFIDFLSDDSDIVQDIASKGLSLVHINSKKEERDTLVSNILDQFTQGRRTVQQVTADTKLFEEGQLGKSPSGGNLSTYREICSLATELQKPELVYYFMHLANNNAIWTSKKGAAFGFAAIASIAKDELNKYLPNIIPRLYRYQFDPTPKIQQSMTSIWRAVVPSTMKAIEQYHKEILTDVTDNLTNNEWRVRISCCNALADLLRTNVQFNFAECGPELWKRLFRVMDDIHEGTRLAATSTAKILSKVCIRYCDSSHGNAGKEVIQAILPVLLDIGITHTVDTVRSISLQTVSQLVSTAGVLLKPSLVNLIPSLLETIGESENPKLSYLSNVCGTSTETQEAIDNVRANVAKGHYASDTITKCIQYVDTDVLKDLMPKVIDLIKCSIGFGTKIACSHFVILLSTHLKIELQPYTAKVLSALLNGLTDRNAAVRKNNAISIGHVVGSAKDSSLDKLFNTLNTWYLEREDDAIRLAIGQTLQSINNYNQEKLKNYQKIVVPLTFFAMHAEKISGNESTIELWTDLWNEITPGTEAGILQNLRSITDILHTTLESASWTTKVQAANAVYTVALKSGHNIDMEARNTLLKILTDGLRGRTWNGKERLLNALAMLACNSKEALNADTALLDSIVVTLHRESKKENAEYRRNALQAFAMVLHELDIDRFTETYEIVQDILIKVSDKSNDDEDTAEESRKKKENNIKLQETVYEVLGKAWPSSKKTQDKYCIEFVTHCQKVLPNSTRSVQIAILTTLNLFVDRLVLLKVSKEEISSQDRKVLDEICDSLNKILLYCINISKFTRIRKEALNIVLSLARKMRDTDNNEQLDKMTRILKELLPELVKDNQPEIRTRVVDIKEMLKI
ncbi:proteasome adapter and scaffold protein ECM29 [Odontomachus brunneus]|uniref:proteasome adapter and scaffold protein ECM29 n=1 Tax=Odontomachus brunneus TaxID=486640 RepID=UPI0013F28228|nr:proteasome adapter and scaffold protein ECM29 [Odontomachus brunneus]XP_032663558.1 proteasome adapter and scaffold protein ECM29 [Odontomachus brunneus]XP_032663559.1 proteasome adapter and scaffold protein ECM29 [Odontomachus brunneus]XP_032663560.1 proteasome adapter and scaffold protein ECM29 [Odontomachus brunneus]